MKRRAWVELMASLAAMALLIVEVYADPTGSANVAQAPNGATFRGPDWDAQRVFLTTE